MALQETESTFATIFRVILQRFQCSLVLCRCGRTRYWISLALLMRGFGAQLPEALQALRIERTRRNRRKHSAARLNAMLAVAEATLLCKFVDLGECALQAFIKVPDTQLAQPRRIQSERTAR